MNLANNWGNTLGSCSSIEIYPSKVVDCTMKQRDLGSPALYPKNLFFQTDPQLIPLTAVTKSPTTGSAPSVSLERHATAQAPPMEASWPNCARNSVPVDICPKPLCQIHERIKAACTSSFEYTPQSCSYCLSLYWLLVTLESLGSPGPLHLALVPSHQHRMTTGTSPDLGTPQQEPQRSGSCPPPRVEAWHFPLLRSRTRPRLFRTLGNPEQEGLVQFRVGVRGCLSVKRMNEFIDQTTQLMSIDPLCPARIVSNNLLISSPEVKNSLSSSRDASITLSKSSIRRKTRWRACLLSAV